MMVSGLLGMVVLVTYPLAPPRLTDLGLMDTVTQSSSACRVLQPPMFAPPLARRGCRRGGIPRVDGRQRAGFVGAARP